MKSEYQWEILMKNLPNIADATAIALDYYFK